MKTPLAPYATGHSSQPKSKAMKNESEKVKIQTF